jgi:hypothetical protein
MAGFVVVVVVVIIVDFFMYIFFSVCVWTEQVFFWLGAIVSERNVAEEETAEWGDREECVVVKLPGHLSGWKKFLFWGE